ncbi:helix-turn-helix transcriptional regulator [Nonomuraea sp. NN258]|uniref:ArsR/SmtB family transcription factor n=1 Tax=Nonomuraea antri TaxID=2730852 RepID=UPI0015687C15|nr:helix-turn-helix domain-containing protein [Nonomuraea antri]NRQ38110.1 helix-turn-helix transcriptional regulator [Nonomuraea antri]
MLDAVAHPLRLRLVGIIASSPSGQACAGDLARILNVPESAVMAHLDALCHASLLSPPAFDTGPFRATGTARDLIGRLIPLVTSA